VLDHCAKARQEAEAQMKDCSYSPVMCSTSAEAVTCLASPDVSYDVLLVDVRCLAEKSPENAAILAAAKTLPLVLMSDSSSPGDVMAGIKQGAVDFLEKPLHMQKLRNIWQHTVRKMMTSSSLGASAPSPGQPMTAAGEPGLEAGSAGVSACASGQGPATGAAAPEDSSSGAGSQSAGGESGSNASTSERAHVKHELMDFELETSSFQDVAMDVALTDSPLAGLTSGFSHFLMGENMGLDAPLLDSLINNPFPTANFTMGSGGQTAAGSSKLARSKGRSSVELRNATLNQSPRPKRVSAPGNGSASSAAGDTGKPALGYSAGQLPALTGPGMVWGLPTNPLQITPKFGAMGPMVPPMPWSLPPMLSGPGASLLPHPSLFGLAPPAAPAPAPPACTPAAPAPAPVLSAAKRAESVPACLPSFGAACDAAAAAAGMTSSISCSTMRMNSESFPDLLGSLDKAQRPPIGLQLKKSPSLLDMITQSLCHGSAPVAS